MKKIYVLLIAMMTFAVSTFAQVSVLLNPSSYGYTFTNTTTTFTSLGATGTVFQSGTTLNTDGVSAAITLPFTFTFNGIKENKIFISNNGFITFETAPANAGYVPLSTTTTSGYDGAIAGTGMNCVASTASGAVPEIRYGTNGGGDFVVQFQDIGQSGFAAIRMTYQIILSVDAKTIQIVYGPNNVGVASAGQCQVGIRGTNDEDWNNRTLASGGNWNTAGGAAGTLNTSAMSLTATTTLPTSGRTFQWAPRSYTPTYLANPETVVQEFTTWANGAGPVNVPTTNWATNGYGNASWQIDNTTASTTGSGWTSTGGAYSPVDYLNAVGGHSARFHSFQANSPQVGYLDYYVNLSTLTGTPSLDFYQINPSGTDILQVFLSTNGGNTFTQIGSNYGVATTWTQRTISLGATNSATTIIRFKATADFGNDDIGIDHLSILVPCTSASGGTASTATPNRCVGQTVAMSSTGATTGSGITYQWKVASTSGGPYSNVIGGTGATTTSYTSAALTAGTFYYVLQTTCSNGPITGLSNEITVTVNAVPTASASSNSPICAGSALNLTGTTDIGVTYAWTGPNSFTSTAQNPTIAAATTAAAGVYSFIATANGCSSIAGTTTVIVNTTPATPTTTNYSICTSATIPVGQGLTSTIVGAGVLTGSQTINFDVAAQPTETNAAPGNTVSSATMAALPTGATVTSLTLQYNGITAVGSSWANDVNLGLSGSVVNAAAVGTGAPGGSGLFNYTRTTSTGITANNAGGTVNLLYWDDTDDNVGAEATFPTGTAVASLVINYSYPNPAAVSWYNASTGGTLIGTGTPFNPIGIDPALPNSNTPGTYSYYAEVANGTCLSTRTQADLIIGAVLTTSSTASPNTPICAGTTVTINTVPSGGGTPFTYSWSDGATVVSTSQSFTATPAVTTTYTVTLGDACGGSITSAVTVTVNPKPTAPVTPAGPISLCTPSTQTLDASGTNAASPAYQWIKDGVAISGANSATYSASASGSYKVRVQNGVTGCFDTSIAVVITVNNSPSNAVVTNYTICQGATVPGGQGLAATSSADVILTSFTGSLAGPSTYVRGQAGTTYSASGVGTAVYYSTHTFQVSATGSYTFNQCAAYDGFGTIHTTSFNPASPATNFLIADDDGNDAVTCATGNDDARIIVSLTAGTTYVLVSSSFSNATTGAYTWTFSGPGNVLAPGAATINWFTTSTGGSSIGTGSPFNPVGVVGSGIANTNTPGVYTFYAEGATASCNSVTRTPVTFTITGSATNVVLASASTNGANLATGCDEAGWTYYKDPTDATKYLYAINWDPTNIGGTFNVAAKTAATTKLQLDASVFGIDDGGLQGTWVMPRYWNVNLNAAIMDGPVNLRFFYNPAEKTATDAAAAAFQAAHPGSVLETPTWFKTNGTDYANDASHVSYLQVFNAIPLTDVSGGSTINGVTYAQFDGITSFSGGSYASGVGFSTPLPIVVNYLQGTKQGTNHNLNWKVTCTSSPSATMVLERSGNNRTFTAINTVTADALRCAQPFNYTDASPLAGINYYRLRITDASGKVTYSNTIAMVNKQTGIDIVGIAPNPVTSAGAAILNVASAQNGKLQIIVTDVIGKRLIVQNASIIAGSNQIQMNFAQLAAGSYQVTAITDDGKATSVRFVKQ